MVIRCLNEKDTGVGLFTNAGRRGSGSPSPEGKEFGRWRSSQSYRFVNKPGSRALRPL